MKTPQTSNHHSFLHHPHLKSSRPEALPLNSLALKAVCCRTANLLLLGRRVWCRSVLHRRKENSEVLRENPSVLTRTCSPCQNLAFYRARNARQDNAFRSPSTLCPLQPRQARSTCMERLHSPRVIKTVYLSKAGGPVPRDPSICPKRARCQGFILEVWVHGSLGHAMSHGDLVVRSLPRERQTRNGTPSSLSVCLSVCLHAKGLHNKGRLNVHYASLSTHERATLCPCGVEALYW